MIRFLLAIVLFTSSCTTTHSSSSKELPTSEAKGGDIAIQPVAAATRFRELVKDNDPENVRLAWSIAASHPSPHIARAMEERLALVSAVANDNPKIYPEVAEAAAANQLIEAYPLIRLNLVKSHDVRFAKALISLDPAKASEDLLAHVARLNAAASEADGARRLVDNDLVTLALSHFSEEPPPFRHPNVDFIFVYAAIGEGAAARHALTTVGRYLEEDPEAAHQLMSRLSENFRAPLASRITEMSAP